jgi:hypothetical protein
MLHNSHVVDYLLHFANQIDPENGTYGIAMSEFESEFWNGYTIRNDKRIVKHAGHKPTAQQCHAVRKLCQLGYSLY